MLYSLDKIKKLYNSVSHKYGNIAGLTFPTPYVENDYGKFYFIGNNRYTDDLNEVRHAQEVFSDRMSNLLDSRVEVFRINYEKLSSRTKTYITSLVEESMRQHSNKTIFYVEEVYFTNGCRSDIKRSLCVVIRPSDTFQTKALYFKIK